MFTLTVHRKVPSRHLATRVHPTPSQALNLLTLSSLAELAEQPLCKLSCGLFGMMYSDSQTMHQYIMNVTNVIGHKWNCGTALSPRCCFPLCLPITHPSSPR